MGELVGHGSIQSDPQMGGGGLDVFVDSLDKANRVVESGFLSMCLLSPPAAKVTIWAVGTQ